MNNTQEKILFGKIDLLIENSLKSAKANLDLAEGIKLQNQIIGNLIEVLKEK